MLDSGSSVIIDVFLDLALALPRRGFVDRHLHRLVPIRHHDGSQGRVFGVNLIGGGEGGDAAGWGW